MAAVDHNYHLDRELATNDDEEPVVSRKYRQRTKQWTVEFIKEDKDYEYIPMLLARIFRLRANNVDEGMLAYVPIAANDPRRIAPTIAASEPPPTSEILLQHKSRFGKK